MNALGQTVEGELDRLVEAAAEGRLNRQLRLLADEHVDPLLADGERKVAGRLIHHQVVDAGP